MTMQCIRFACWIPKATNTTQNNKGNPVTDPWGPIGWVEVKLNSFLTSALEGVCSQHHAPAAFTPGKKPGTHCTGGWVDPGAGLDRCRNSCPPPEFDPRTLQPVASRYTKYAIPAPRNMSYVLLFHSNNGYANAPPYYLYSVLSLLLFLTLRSFDKRNSI